MRSLVFILLLNCVFYLKAQTLVVKCFPFKKDNKWGLCSSDGKKIFQQPIYDKIEGYNNYYHGCSYVLYKVFLNNKVGLVDTNCVLTVKPEFDDVMPYYQKIMLYDNNDFHNMQYYKVKQGLKEGLLDNKGNICLPIRFDYIIAYPCNYNDTSIIFKQLLVNDSVYMLNPKNQILLKYKNNKLYWLENLTYYYGKWVCTYKDKKYGKYYSVILDENGKEIIKSLNSEIKVFGLYDNYDNPTKNKNIQFCVINQSNNKSDYRFLLKNNKLSQSFKYIERQLNDSLFVVSVPEFKRDLLYNIKTNQLQKISGTLNYSLNLMDVTAKNSFFRIDINKKSSVIDSSSTPLFPFVTSDSVYFSLEYPPAGQYLIRSFPYQNITKYYTLQGKYIATMPGGGFTYNSKLNVFYDNKLIINTKGDTLLYSKIGFYIQNQNKFDTLNVLIRKEVRDFDSKVLLFKVKDKALFIDSGYVSYNPNYYKNSYTLYDSTITLRKSPYTYGRVYTPQLNFIANGVELFNSVRGVVILHDNGTTVYNQDGNIIINDSCAPLMKNEYIERMGEVPYSKNIKGFKKWNYYAYMNQDSATLSSIRYNWPMRYYNKVKINDKYYLTNRELTNLCEIEDTSIFLNKDLFNKFSQNLIHYPIKNKKAEEILSKYNIITNSLKHLSNSWFYAVTNNEKILFDSIGNPKANMPLTKEDKSNTDWRLLRGSFCKLDSFYWFKSNKKVQFKIDTSNYDLKEFFALNNELVCFPIKKDMEKYQANGKQFSIFDSNGVLLFDKIVFPNNYLPHYTVQFNLYKVFIVITVGKTYKLINSIGEVIYESNEPFYMKQDAATSLWYISSKEHYTEKVENAILYFNLDGIPVIIK